MLHGSWRGWHTITQPDKWNWRKILRFFRRGQHDKRSQVLRPQDGKPARYSFVSPSPLIDLDSSKEDADTTKMQPFKKTLQEYWQ